MREFCQVDLYYGFKGYLSQDCASSLLFKALRKLTGFRLVTVHVDCEQNQGILTTDDNRIMMISNTRNVDLYIARVKTALEPTLGAATWRKMSLKSLYFGLSSGNRALRNDQHLDLA